MRFTRSPGLIMLLAGALGSLLNAEETTSPAVRVGPITDAERQHWSFQPVVRPEPPSVTNENQALTPIDRFLLARLEQRGLPLAPQATKRQLIRRVTFDLTGLPPKPEDIRAFLEDRSPDAFSTVVERLLQSPHYGERWGRHWLDVVRYADTAGETADYPIPLAWRYRNYVIDAFNSDKPYDQFLREQIAGDILARAEPRERYLELATATGFLAISRRFGFGIEQYHYLTIQDTIDTTGQAILGLSIGCARCHDHKYDPINEADYYGWYGIFESTHYSLPGDEKTKKERQFVPAIPAPEAHVAKEAFDTETKALAAEIDLLTKERESLGGNGWVDEVEARLLPEAIKDHDGHQGFHVWRKTPLPIVGLNASGSTLNLPPAIPDRNVVIHPEMVNGVAIIWRSPVDSVVKLDGRIVDKNPCGDSVLWYVDHLRPSAFENIAHGDVPMGGQNDLSEFNALGEISVNAGEYLQVGLLPGKDYGCDLTLVDLRIHTVDGTRSWHLAEDIYDGFLETNPLPDKTGTTRVWHFCTLTPDRGQEVAKGFKKPATEDPEKQLRRLGEITKRLDEIQPRHEQLLKTGPYDVIYGAMEGSEPGDSKIQIRGEPESPGPIVPRRNLEILGGQPIRDPEKSSGRLDLAAWLSSNDNPLTARVMVNRIWHYHFGTGIVESPNDFGVRGRRPSFPALLDWLAAEFMASGWSIKHMHRIILESRVYQLSSSADSKHTLSEYDEYERTRLFGRYTKRRLDAEAVRDSMLAVSGTLDRTPGQEHPFPPSASWSFNQTAPFLAVYENTRRSVYLMTQRLQKHPFLALFDGADTNASTGQRAETTTPPQALFLLNNEFVHEQARAFAELLITEVDGDRNRVQIAFERALGRPPTADEVDSTLTFVSKYRRLLAAPGTIADASQNLDAWAAFARTLLARNEFLHVD